MQTCNSKKIDLDLIEKLKQKRLEQRRKGQELEEQREEMIKDLSKHISNESSY